MLNFAQRYAPDLPPVLHGISFTLQARERIGLLGRTGIEAFVLTRSAINRFVKEAANPHWP